MCINTGSKKNKSDGSLMGSGIEEIWKRWNLKEEFQEQEVGECRL